MSKKSYIVDGFCFDLESDAKEAENEKKGIAYIKQKIDYKNPSSALATYNMINEKGLFKTPLGISFMYEVRTNIIKNGVKEEDVPPIILKTGTNRDKRSEASVSPFKARFVNMLILNAILLVMFVIFAVIASNSKNLNIINYQNRIDAQYRDLENSLNDWSRELKIKEQQLNERESELQDQ